MTTATKVKCACDACMCEVDPSTALAKDGAYYCSKACAEGHPEGAACVHSACTCHN